VYTPIAQLSCDQVYIDLRWLRSPHSTLSSWPCPRPTLRARTR